MIFLVRDFSLALLLLVYECMLIHLALTKYPNWEEKFNKVDIFTDFARLYRVYQK